MTYAKKAFEKSRNYVFRNGRPLDLALWNYHFEDKNKEEVLKYLSAFQNPDGGFGHGLEPDCCSPNSSPMQTWKATTVLLEIGMTDSSHPIIKGILKYLDSRVDFDKEQNQWYNTVKSNNDYPHAIWWEWREGQDNVGNYNPTASLAGFVLAFGDKSSTLYKDCEVIVKQAFDFFINNVPIKEMHIANVFQELYYYLSKTGSDIVDMKLFEEKLHQEIRENICTDTEKWAKEYVPRPSLFIHSKDHPLYKEYAELIDKECDMLLSTQLQDGSFPAVWNWCTDYKEEAVSEMFWKSSIAKDNMLMLKNCGRLSGVIN